MKKHPPIYYTIRTFVRTAFWGTLGLAGLVMLLEVTVDDRPACDIRITEFGRWESNNEPVDTTKCVAPPYMVLHRNGTWDWVEE